MEEKLIVDKRVNARVTDVERKMVNTVKEHYGFKTDRQLILALVRRALISIDK